MLARITSAYHCVFTPAVLEEIDRGYQLYPFLSDVRKLDWLHTVVVDSPHELVVFNHYVRILGSSDRNIGGASLLAWAEVHAAVAVMDDNAAVQAAKARRVLVRRSLGLLCNAIHRDVLAIDVVRSLIDDLKALGGATLPCDGAGFEHWAEARGLLGVR